MLKLTMISVQIFLLLVIPFFSAYSAEGVVKNVSSIIVEDVDIGAGWTKEKEQSTKSEANVQYRLKRGDNVDFVDVDIMLVKSLKNCRDQWNKIRSTYENHPDVVFHEIQNIGEDAFAVGKKGNRIYMFSKNVIITMFVFEKHENGLEVAEAFDRKIR